MALEEVGLPGFPVPGTYTPVFVTGKSSFARYTEIFARFLAIAFKFPRINRCNEFLRGPIPYLGIRFVRNDLKVRFIDHAEGGVVYQFPLCEAWQFSYQGRTAGRYIPHRSMSGSVIRCNEAGAVLREFC